MKFGEPAPFELVRWQMAERFGWTLEYIDSLSLQALSDWQQIEDGRIKARTPQASTYG